MSGELLLAGDIGGTKTALALFRPVTGAPEPQHHTVFPSADYPSLGAIVTEFRKAHGEAVAHACFAVAGPVIEGRARITNLPWTLDAELLRDELRVPSVALVNDLAATALSVPLLRNDQLLTLASGRPEAGGTVAVIAPGTGLGEAFLSWEGDVPRAHASEGGHCDFAPANSSQAELLAYLREQEAHVSVERVCSGMGIPSLYAFLRDSGRATESAGVRRRLDAAEDHTPVISQSATGPDGDPLCRMTMELFVDILGAEAGNLALKVLATGGVYLAGGIPKRITGLLAGDRFLSAFRAKGRMAELVGRMPVHVVLEQSALLGCASLGLRQIAAGARTLPAGHGAPPQKGAVR